MDVQRREDQLLDKISSEMLAAYGIDGCGCASCVGEVVSRRPFPENLMYPFIVCGSCGNKRCPQAAHHDNECTGSNEPGQPGSSYPVTNGPRRTFDELRALLEREPSSEPWENNPETDAR